ncbi:hypothetical protein CsatB_014672 [Cannabis sativa]
MDRDWMSANRLTVKYREGVDFILEFFAKNADNPNLVHCPCLKCGNMERMTIVQIREHLFKNGIDRSYKVWYHHGQKIRRSSEGPSRKDKIVNNVEYEDDHIAEMINEAEFESQVRPETFQTMLEDAEKPIYTNCSRFTKLSTLIRLYNLKAKHGWSDKSLTELLAFLGELLPEGNEVPLSFYDAKKTLCSLGLQYEKIHACPNNCILYQKRFVDAVACPTCGECRWQKKKNSNEVKKGVPAKVLWNIRLGLSADGINPHTSLSSKYSCWPIFLVIYNLPPWLVMKRKFTMLTLMISGRSQPGNDIDVYLAPLIDDLSKLWYDGVNAYDAYRNEAFNLGAMLLWTINDFPAFENLSGYRVKGYYACLICEEKTCSRYLTHWRKICYMGHRKFLPPEHVFRTWKKAFDGKQEFEMPSPPLSGRQLVEKLKKNQFNLEKRKSKSKKRKGGKGVTNEPQGPWKKKSIFFELEYWEHLVLRHNFDVMHIEKNVSDSLINTLFNIPGRSKDGIKSRLDLKEMGIRGNLHPEIVGK